MNVNDATLLMGYHVGQRFQLFFGAKNYEENFPVNILLCLLFKLRLGLTKTSKGLPRSQNYYTVWQNSESPKWLFLLTFLLEQSYSSLAYIGWGESPLSEGRTITNVSTFHHMTPMLTAGFTPQGWAASPSLKADPNGSPLCLLQRNWWKK